MEGVMSPQKRTLAALSALLMTVLCVLGSSQTALASDGGSTTDGTRVTGVTTQYRTFTAPPAPAEADGGFGSMAVPTINPTVAVTYANPGGQYNCEYGTMCAWSWDTSRNQWKIFHLYNCHKYALSNWTSEADAGFVNNQTAGTVARFYGQNGSTEVVPASTAFDDRSVYDGNFGGWDPVWFIRNC
jgi:hypothetical protein